MNEPRFLSRLVPPRLPDALRARTLACADAAWDRRSTWGVRVWESRALRWAWSVAMLLAILGHLSIDRRPAPRSPAELTLATVRRVEVAEWRSIVQLPRLLLDERSGWGPRRAAPPTTPPTDPS